MQRNFGTKSIALFLLSVVLLILLTTFESRLSGLSLAAEKLLSLLLLVFPGVIGAAFGILSITRKESKPWIAGLGLVLNSLFALFHICVISFAG